MTQAREGGRVEQEPTTEDRQGSVGTKNRRAAAAAVALIKS